MVTNGLTQGMEFGLDAVDFCFKLRKISGTKPRFLTSRVDAVLVVSYAPPTRGLGTITAHLASFARLASTTVGSGPGHI